MTTSTQLKSFSQTTADLHRLLSPIFAKITDENWDQTEGKYFVDQEKPQCCCIGAHIAKALELPLHEAGGYDNAFYLYSDATDYLVAKFGLSEFQLNAIFYCAGSSSYAFGSERWPLLPSKVLDNVRLIETAPPKLEHFRDENGMSDNEAYSQAIHKWIATERPRFAPAKVTA